MASPHLKDPKLHINPELVFSAIPLFTDPRIPGGWANLEILWFITLTFQAEIQTALDSDRLNDVHVN